MHYYTSCEIGSSEDSFTSDITSRAYAHHFHHGISKFSFVSVSGEEDNGDKAIWYCRIISFLDMTISAHLREDGTFLTYFKTFFNSGLFLMLYAEIHQVAFVEYLRKADTRGKVDPLLKCTKLIWEMRSKRFKIIELANILKIVHVVPGFRGDSRISEEFYLNKFIFK